MTFSLKKLLNQRNPANNEISLFTELALILKIDYNVTYVHTTHQKYVCFDSIMFKSKVRREISDLLIIMYSHKKREARMTFLQAKYHRRPLEKPFCFHGTYLQYELLSERPTLYSNTHFPEWILNFTQNDTIGTYGVFYKDAQGSYDLVYATASSIKCKTLPSSTTNDGVIMCIPNLEEQTPVFKCFPGCMAPNLTASFGLDYFKDSILKLHIGAEIHHERELLHFLKRAFLSQQQNDSVIIDFISFIDEFDIYVNPNDLNEAMNIPSSSVMLINVDEKQ